ncbi:MAG: DUF4238 domain-containing protein [Candidatus Acidiferrales bacterium]
MPIGSHIIPRAYLNQFANSPTRKGGEKLIWVYEKGKKPQLRATKRQGAENGYFGLVTQDGKLDESLEMRLAELESACLETLELTATRFFDIQSASRRNKLAFYACMLFNRAEQRRNRGEKTHVSLQAQFADLLNDDKWIAETAARCVAIRREVLEPQDLKEIIARAASTLTEPTALRNGFVEQLIGVTEIMKNVALQKPWQLWRAPGGAEFVTSDNPFVTFVDLGNGRLNSGHGLRKQETIGFFPLSPYVGLAMGAQGPDTITIGAAHVTNINNVVIELCEKYVYSKNLFESVRQSVDERANTRVYGVNTHLPLGINVPTAKDFVLHVLKLAPWPFPDWLKQSL